MLQTKINKPRTATQHELKELFEYESARRYSATADLDYSQAQLKKDITSASIAVWSEDKYWCKRMIVLWGQEAISFYGWYSYGFDRIGRYRVHI